MAFELRLDGELEPTQKLIAAACGIARQTVLIPPIAVAGEGLRLAQPFSVLSLEWALKDSGSRTLELLWSVVSGQRQLLPG